MAKLKEGDQAPDFSLPDQNGRIHRLKNYRGKTILLYFYPKDDTPGCTKEACALRDNFSGFNKHKTVILGISVDSPQSHRKFAEKYKLPFTLLADQDKKTVKLYGVWGKKKFMSREYMGTFRKSFLINPRGRVAKIYEEVKTTEHAEEVLEGLKTARRNKK